MASTGSDPVPVPRISFSVNCGSNGKHIPQLTAASLQCVVSEECLREPCVQEWHVVVKEDRPRWVWVEFWLHVERSEETTVEPHHLLSVFFVFFYIISNTLTCWFTFCKDENLLKFLISDYFLMRFILKRWIWRLSNFCDMV